MRILIVIIAALLLMGCKTKQNFKESAVEKEFLKIDSKKDSIKNESKIQKKEISKEVLHTDQKKENQTDIEVKGKAEVGKPLEIYNIENGDTIQAFKVTGNAEVQIRTKNSKSENVIRESNKESFVEKLKDFSQNIVVEHNVKERVDEMKKKTQEVTTRTGTFWSFGLITIFGVVTLLIIGLIFYFKK